MQLIYVYNVQIQRSIQVHQHAQIALICNFIYAFIRLAADRQSTWQVTFTNEKTV